MQSQFMLIATDGQGRTAQVPISVSPLRIGRDPSNHVVFPSAAVGPYALSLHQQPDGSLWAEPHSQVFVNGVPLMQARPLTLGDVVQIGDARIQVQMSSSAAQAASPFRPLPPMRPPPPKEKHYPLFELLTHIITICFVLVTPFAFMRVFPWLTPWVGLSVGVLMSVIVPMLCSRGILPLDAETPSWSWTTHVMVFAGAIIAVLLIQPRAWHNVAVHNPLKTTATFTFSRGGPTIEVAPGERKEVTVASGEFKLTVRAAGQPTHELPITAELGSHTYVASSSRDACYALIEINYSRVSSLGSGPMVLDRLTGQNWYDASADYLLTQPPSTITVKRGESSTRKWFRSIPCDGPIPDAE